jgi:RNase P subunit RPR2
MMCPACGLDERYQIDPKGKTPLSEGKVQCRGCGTIFFDKDKARR